MSFEPSVLLVCPTLDLRETLAAALLRAGYKVVIARNFESAKRQLTLTPALLIAELKLGAYNGLQLALRSQAVGIPAVVVADKSFEHEVEQLGAVWLSSETAAAGDVQTVIMRVLQGVQVVQSSYWYESEQAGQVQVPLTNSPVVH